MSGGNLKELLSEEEIRCIHRNEFYPVDSLNYFDKKFSKSLYVNLFDALNEFDRQTRDNGERKFSLEEIYNILTDLADEI